MNPKSAFLFSAFCLLFSAFCNIHAQLDTRGREFWLTFGKNSDNSASKVDLQIRIVSGAQPVTTGTIEFTQLGTSISFSITAYKVYTCTLSNAEKQAVYNETMGINNHSVRITASAPVSVYALNQAYVTTDATTVFPVTVLGTEYYHISYYPNYSRSDAYAIVATQDNTQLYHNGTSAATLQKGQVYYRTALNTDMTGTHITANKPIAFFAVNQGPQIPRGAEFVDHIFHQLAPVNTWGKTFFVPVSSLGQDIIRIVASENNTVITQKGGLILQGGYTLNAGQFAEFVIPLFYNGCYIQTNKPVGVCTYLAGSSYNGGGSSDPAQAWLPPIEQLADTALIAPFIPSGKTALNAHFALVVTPTAAKSNTRVKIGAGAEQTLSGGIWYDNNTAGISFYSMGLLRTNDTSTYLYTNPAGLILMAYGTGSDESYYYLASSLMQDLTVALYVNDVYYLDLTSNVICTQPVQFCIKIDGNVSTNKGHIKWYINDVEETTVSDTLCWEKSFVPGSYRIKVEVLAANNRTIRTSETVITVEKPILDQPKDINLCAEETVLPIFFSGTNIDTVFWVADNGTAIGMPANTGAGTIPSFTANNTTADSLSVTVTATPKSAGGCEGEPKIFTITVYRKEPLNVNLGNDTTICRLDSLLLHAGHPNADSYQWHDASTKTTYIAYNKEGQIWVIVKARCNKVSDTINVTLFKDLKMNLGRDITFCENDVIYKTLNATTTGVSSYLWQDESTSPVFIAEQPGIYSVTVSNICMSVSDSIEIKTKDCSVLEIWFPNAFMPDGDGINDIFKPEINDPELLKEYEMTIYNRWGNLIFTTQDYLTGWNGKDHRNKTCSEGVYTGIIKYKNNEGRDFIRRVSITLLR